MFNQEWRFAGSDWLEVIEDERRAFVRREVEALRRR